MNERWTISRNEEEVLYETHSADLPLADKIWETTEFEQDILKMTLGLNVFEDFEPIQQRVTGGVDYSEVLPWMVSVRVLKLLNYFPFKVLT